MVSHQCELLILTREPAVLQGGPREAAESPSRPLVWPLTGRTTIVGAERLPGSRPFVTTGGSF